MTRNRLTGLLLALGLCVSAPALSQGFVHLLSGNSPVGAGNPLPVSPNGSAPLNPAHYSSVRTTIAATSTTLTFAHPATSVFIAVEAGSSNIYVNPTGGAATTGNAQIAAGGAVAIALSPNGTSSITYIGDGTTGYIDYIAQAP